MLTVDLPGHGDNAPLSASLDESAQLLADALPKEPFILGGYSFGARVALHLALRHPDRLTRLILLGATRGIENPIERASRVARDERLANRVEQIGTERFLDEWLAQPLFSSLAPDAGERAARSRDAHGLAQSLRHAGTGTQAWLGEQLANCTVDTLALAGALDEKFAREAMAIAANVTCGAFALVPGAGHAAHLERPAETAALIDAAHPQ